MQSKDISDKNKLYIMGCGGHARSILNVVKTNAEEVTVVLVDENALENETIMECCVVSDHKFQKGDKVIVAIGNNVKRRKVFDDLICKEEIDIATIVSNTATIGIGVKLGKGCFVSANAYLGPQVEIGNNTIINTGSIVEHECRVGNHVHIAPNVTICGRTIIGNDVFCGAGSIIVDGISICDNVTVGAGAVVVDDLVEPGTYVGVPARKVRR